MVYGRTGTPGANVTLVVVPEQVHEPAPAQILRLHVVVRIVKVQHRKLQSA